MANERKAYSDEQKAAIKARRDERNAAIRAMIEKLTNAKELSTEDFQELKGLAEIAAPKSGSGGGKGTGRVSVMSKVSDLFDTTDEISEDDVFMRLKLGRSEMATATKNIIKKFSPEDRKWISFDPESGFYTLEGSGATPPQGWTGYVPVDEVVEDDEDEDEEYDVDED